MSLFYDNGGFQKHFDLLSVKSLLTVDYADSVLSSVSNLAALQVIGLTVLGIGFNAGQADTRSGSVTEDGMGLPAKAEKILNILHDEGYEAYVVGGCVRDRLLGRTVYSVVLIIYLIGNIDDIGTDSHLEGKCHVIVTRDGKICLTVLTGVCNRTALAVSEYADLGIGQDDSVLVNLDSHRCVA